jgi:hypothetical protein
MSSFRDLKAQVDALKSRGVSLPRHPQVAQSQAAEMHRMASSPGELAKDMRSFGRVNAANSQEALAQLEHQNRIQMAMRQMRRHGSSDTALAIPRFYDPMEYWDLSGLPWNMADEGHRHKLHKWMQLFYATHYLVPILVDIFTRFPLVGLEIECPDPDLKDFYEDLFLDQLKYEDFLMEVGRQYWCSGEAFPLGSFNENLGVWEREELINPELIVIETIAPLGNQVMKLVPSESLKRLVREKTPASEYKQLEDNFPEIIPYLMREEPIPVSDVLLKQIAFKNSPWDTHGTPILLRALRTLMHEEKLLASQDAIAERLYSPLILAKLGAPDMGGDYGPWLPDPGQLEEFRDDLDVALSADFRVMVYHYALEMQNVFGREQVPDLGNDFDRIERRLMQVFGINPSLLSGGDSGQPYASSALHAEFMNQMLRTFQNVLKEHFRSRAAVVAEAQGHYAYDKKGTSRIPIMEDVVEYDDEGKMHIVQKPKLLIPELGMAAFDLRDEATERQFRAQLRSMGVPIPDDKLMVGVDMEFDDLLDEMSKEIMKKTVQQQQVKLDTYKVLKAKKLPIPPALKAEVEGIVAGEDPAAMGGEPGGPGGPGPMGPGGPGISGPPGGGSTVIGPPLPGDLAGDLGVNPGSGMGPPPTSPLDAGGAGARPPVSDERRPGMPGKL